MKITGKIIQALPLASGVSKAGNNWQRQDYILETIETFPKKICFSVMGDKIEKLGIQIGQTLDVSVDIDSREYNGRWYTSVTAWAASPAASEQPAAPAATAASPFPASPWPSYDPLAR